RSSPLSLHDALPISQLLDVVDAGQAARGEHRHRERLRELDGGLDIDAREHAVAPDVGVDHALDAVVLELAREIDHLVAGELAPRSEEHTSELQSPDQ